MIAFSSFEDLLQKYKQLPDVGWLYVKEPFDLESEDDIINGVYYLAEDEDEEIEFEENYGTFLEAPIFKAIIENKRENSPDSTSEDFLKATIYYLEKDDFLD